MAISDLVQRIKETPISQIIGLYLPLTRKGGTTKAQCPFHDDHDPSLHISDERQMFKCYVDGTSGDAIDFVTKYKNLEFLDALKELCSQLGWSFDDYYEAKNQNPRSKMAYRLLEKAALLYQKLGNQGEPSPLEHFGESRMLDRATLETYELGFAPAGGALLGYLHSIKDDKERELALSVALEIGLIKPSQKGRGHYDTFRDRITFPIWDHFGKVIGFTSRAIRDDQIPKYLNSKDSQVFNKRNLLYGLHLAKPYIRSRDAVIVCEGNMDQIALYQNGFENSVAIMGTALGTPSLKRLLSFTKNIYFALDNDDAGEKAAERILNDFLLEGVIPRKLDFAECKDPDDYLKKYGAEALSKQLEDAPYFIDLLAAKIRGEGSLGTDEKLKALEGLFNVLKPLGDQLLATERVISFAREIELQSDSEALLSTYRKFLEGQKRPAAPITTKSTSVEVETTGAQGSEDLSPRQQTQKVLTRAEKRLIQQLILNPACLDHQEFDTLLAYVEDSEVKRYILKLRDVFYEVDDLEFAKVVQSLGQDGSVPAAIRDIAGSASFEYRPHQLDGELVRKILTDLESKLREDQLISERNQLRALQREAAEGQDQHEILTRLNQIQKEIHQLRR